MDADADRRFVRLGHDERRSSILACAGELFLDRPYGEVKMADIAEAAGVARGLLHHYFGSKRELYVEVLREVMSVASMPLPPDATDADRDEVWAANVEAWMTLMAANREQWLAAIGMGSAGHDPELAAVLDEAREVVAARTLEVLRLESRPELLAIARGFGGFAEEITREWLDHGRLSREQARVLLEGVMPMIVDRLLAEVDAPGREGGGGH